MGRGVHLWSEYDDVHLGQKVAAEDAQHAGQYGEDVDRHGEGVPADEVECEVAYPADHVHHQAEGHALGLVVVGRQVLAHVAEGEAQAAEQRGARQLHPGARRERVAALQHDAVGVYWGIITLCDSAKFRLTW